MTLSPLAPPPANRPKMWRYCRDRDLKLADVAGVFGRTAEWARLICLPFEDPKRRVPAPEDVARIHAWSGGEIGPADWYPPELSVPPASNLNLEPRELVS